MYIISNYIKNYFKNLKSYHLFYLHACTACYKASIKAFIYTENITRYSFLTPPEYN